MTAQPPPSIYKLDPSASSLSFASTHPVIVKRGAMNSRQGGDEYDYRFDALHLPPAPTEDLYDAKIQPVVRAAMNGFNGTVFA
jgi:centromeric protein E